MSEENLLTASRRMVRYFNIDICHGGIVMEETEQALGTLEAQIEKDTRKTSLREAAVAFIVCFNGDLNNGGLVTVPTQQALAMLDRRVREAAAIKVGED